MLSCIKAYDIRGRIPNELNEDVAWRIGHAFADSLRCERVVAGHDVRRFNPQLATSLGAGLNDGGSTAVEKSVCAVRHHRLVHRLVK